ncbi:MAG: peptidoglycan DD-metalloendopeptidase family protein [Clostridia bacterium]|nr:peptidoglycan DD-metalloendopeptidase family protein [Clostridia bacterium]
MYKLCNMHKWACLFVILSITLCALPGSADFAKSDTAEASGQAVDSTVAGLRAEIQRLKEEQQALDEQIQLAKEEVGGAIRQKTLMDQQILLLASEVECYDRMLEHYDGVLNYHQTSYDQLSASYDAHFAVLGDRLRQSREEGVPSQPELFRNSKNLLDLLVGLERLREIDEFDRSLMDSLEREQSEMAALRRMIEAYRVDRHTAALERVERMQLLNTQLQASGNYLHSLMDDVNRFSYYIQQSQAGKQIADRTITEQVKALQDRLAEEGSAFWQNERAAKLFTAGDAVKAQMESGSIQKGADFYADGNTFIWPLVIVPHRDATVLSQMGYRTYQVGGKLFTSYHGGVDLSADYGSHVLAAASGMVVAADRADGYGDYVVILHDDGSQTRYAYLGKALVNVGDYVLQGEAIATAGVSGNSAGIGCHFELYIDGAQVNPMEYLTIPKSEQSVETTDPVVG